MLVSQYKTRLKRHRKLEPIPAKKGAMTMETGARQSRDGVRSFMDEVNQEEQPYQDKAESRAQENY